MAGDAHIILHQRETEVLEEIVRNYIMTAAPTGSRFIAKKMKFRLSAATIRNIMGGLEEKGLITHPHTSAGRIPTDSGYRHYVDGLMRMGTVPKRMQEVIRSSLAVVSPSDIHLIMEATSKALSKATNQLGVILAPRLNNGVFRHVHIYEIAQSRYMVHLTIDTGFVKTLVLELESEIPSSRIENVCQIINERFYGMTLDQMCGVEDRAFSDVADFELGIIRLFIPSIRKMVLEPGPGDEQLYTEGEMNMLLKPEFAARENVGAIIEILEEKRLLMHLFNTADAEPGRVTVSIGGEIEKGQFSSFSIVKTRYRIGHLEGSMGIIGPKRMRYPLLVAAVDYTARTLSEMYTAAH